MIFLLRKIFFIIHNLVLAIGIGPNKHYCDSDSDFGLLNYAFTHVFIVNFY